MVGDHPVAQACGVPYCPTCQEAQRRAMRLTLDPSFKRGRGARPPALTHQQIALQVLYEQVVRWEVTMLSCDQCTPQAVHDALDQAEKALGLR